MDLTQDILRELFDYAKGALVWKRDMRANKVSGKVAGYVNSNGYRHISIGGNRYYAHSLVYIYHNGSYPRSLEIDHINRDKDDNRIENLRLVTRRENAFNKKGRGCSLRPSGRYEARIKVDGKLYQLGMFDTEQEVHDAYLKAKKDKHIIKERVA